MKTLLPLNDEELQLYQELKPRFKRYKSALFTKEEIFKYNSIIDKLVQGAVLEEVASNENTTFYILINSFQKYEKELIEFIHNKQ